MLTPNSPIIWVLAGMVTIGSIVGLLWYGQHLVDKDNKLCRKGIPGTARVLSLRQTGTWAANNPLVEIELEIRLPDRAPYVTTFREVLPVIHAPAVQPGTSLRVRVTADDPGRIVLDEPWSR